MHAISHPLTPHGTAWSPTAAIAGAVAGGAVFLSLSNSPGWWVAAGCAAAFAAAAAAAAVDARTGRIPDRWVVASATPIAIVVAALALTGNRGLVAGALLGVVALAGPLLALHVLSPAAMGFGDVKLALPLGAVVGVADPRSAVLALLIASGLALTGAVALRRSTVPFGPGLVAGAALAVALTTIGDLAPWR